MIEYLTTSLTPELCCSNIKTSLAFYIDVLGFKIQYERSEEGFAMLEREGARIMLDEITGNLQDKGKRTWLAAPLEPPYGRGINLEIRTKHVEKLYKRCNQLKATIFLPLENKWYRADNLEIGNRQFIVLDPDGYMLRFAQDLGKRTLQYP